LLCWKKKKKKKDLVATGLAEDQPCELGKLQKYLLASSSSSESLQVSSTLQITLLTIAYPNYS